MSVCFKLIFFTCFLGSFVYAKESGFQSGIGFTLGLGTASIATRARDGAEISKFSTSGSLVRDIVDDHALGWNAIGNSETLIDFGQKGIVKTRSGFSWHLGALMQKKMGNYFLGFRWIFGFNHDSSKISYPAGKWSIESIWRGLIGAEENYLGDNYGVLNDSAMSFSLKNKWFNSFIFELGYFAINKIQLFLGPGIVLQHQKFSYINKSGESLGGLSKTVAGPMMAFGARYALTQRIALGLEYQRQWLNRKTWHQVSKIIPDNIISYGMPTLKTNNNLFLVTLSYMFRAK
ncbi:outer membrane protein [Holospora obtusa]|nr:hypothetical protein [Holospora obtusa]